ncbi:MAG: hypothetical protein Q9213_002120 [Squamulea squamosa]
MRELRKALATCTNLQKLSVKSISDTAIRGGLTLIEPGVQLPRLRLLKIRGLELADYNSSGWSKAVDWDALEYFETSDTTFLHFIMPSMKMLRSLKLIEPRSVLMIDEEALLNFVYGLPNLEHLSVVGLTDLVMASELLKHKGGTLRTLKLHEYEPDERRIRSGCRTIPNEEYIRRLGNMCTQLNTCAIDIKAGASWPWKLLLTIAESLWFLVHLELDIELQPSKSTTGSLQVTLITVRQLWDFLWTNIARVREQRNHIISIPRLRTLKISTSDPKKDSLRFEARLSERDDLAAKGHADVVCLELEGLRNKYGDGPLENKGMEIFRRDLTTRVEKGPILPNQTWEHFDQFQARPLRTTLTEMAEW